MTTEAGPHNSEAAFDRIADALATLGYVVLTDCLPVALGEALRQRLIPALGSLQQAGIGRGRQHTLAAAIRTDTLRWLLPDSPAEFGYLAWMEQLRLGLNRRLLLGLFDYEAHFAVYAAGGHYHQHLDAFQGGTNRVLSTVFYLNPHWSPADGGELRIHAATGDALVATVMPEFGTLVLFLSASFPHEVAITHRPRYSIAGWFRGR
jgi:SM-20-related protein